MDILETDYHSMARKLMEYNSSKEVWAILKAECKGQRRRSFITRIIARYAELKRLEAIEEAEQLCHKAKR